MLYPRVTYLGPAYSYGETPMPDASGRVVPTVPWCRMQAHGLRLSGFCPVDTIVLDPCVYCLGPSEQTDHVEPWSNGGSNDWTNLAPSCAPCNSAKGRRSLLGFLLWKAYAPEREALSNVDGWHRPVTREDNGQNRKTGAARARARGRIAA